MRGPGRARRTALVITGVLALLLLPAGPARPFIESVCGGTFCPSDPDLALHLDPGKMGCAPGPPQNRITFDIDIDGSADVTPASDGTDALLAAFISWDAPSIPETDLDLCTPNVTQLGTFDGDALRWCPTLRPSRSPTPRCPS